LGICLDTSALAKLYRPEIGTAVVERMIDNSSGDCFISRLVVLEMHSVLSQKTRAGEIPSSDSALVLQRFRKDIRVRRFRVVALSARHYEIAEELVERVRPDSWIADSGFSPPRCCNGSKSCETHQLHGRGGQNPRPSHDTGGVACNRSGGGSSRLTPEASDSTGASNGGFTRNRQVHA